MYNRAHTGSQYAGEASTLAIPPLSFITTAILYEYEMLPNRIESLQVIDFR